VAERRSAQQRPPLTRAQVVSEALAAIDADGVDALTMRKLADRLGVYPTAVYWHAGNKAALLAAVCEHVLAELELPPVHDGTDWQEWIRAMARAARATLHAHPNIVPVMGGQMQVVPSSFPLVESVLTVLRTAGFEGSRLTDAYNTVIGFVFGWIFGELSAEPTDADADWTEAFRRRLYSASPSATPVLAANLPHLAGQALMLRWESGSTHPLDSSFAMAVDVLVAGLAVVARAT